MWYDVIALPADYLLPKSRPSLAVGFDLIAEGNKVCLGTEESEEWEQSGKERPTARKREETDGGT